MVAVVDFFQVKLEFVVIGDGDVQSNKSALGVIKALSKSREVFVGVVPPTLCSMLLLVLSLLLRQGGTSGC
jgi:hypothetical protein